jgi:hypothetical protein
MTEASSTEAQDGKRTIRVSLRDRIHVKDSLLGEFILAVVWVSIYEKAGRSWDGLAAQAIKYHWPGSAAFQDLFAPGLQIHSRDIAWAFPFVAIFIACSWDWPIGGYTVFICGIAYSYLTLGWPVIIPIVVMSLVMRWLLYIWPPLYNMFAGLVLTIVCVWLAMIF